MFEKLNIGKIGWDKEAQEHKDRLDKLIEQNKEIIKLLEQIEENTRKK